MGKLPLSLIVAGSILVALSVACGLFSLSSNVQDQKQHAKEGRQGRIWDDEPEPGPWDLWENLETQHFMTIRVFHTLNPKHVSLGENPVLEERGPYVYEERRVKLDLKLNKWNETMSYRERVEYFFRPDMSNGTEEDVVTVLNVPLAMLAMKGFKGELFAQMVLASVIEDHEEDEKLFSHTTVGELLFGGRHVPMMKTLDDTTGTSPLKNYTFGVFFPKNGSDEGTLEVKTGVTNPMDFGKVVSWKNQTKLDFWGGDTCNMINGTDGSLFAPFVKRDRTVYLFSPDLCRSLYLTYTEDTELKGIKGYRFGVPRAALAGPAENKANECFCLEPATDYNNCLGAGAIQLSACRNGAPIVMSTPHFFNGDQKYSKAAIGLKPDKEKHQTFVDLEPTTGFILRSHKRFQVNIHIAPTEISPHFSHIPDILYPILWYDEHAEMSNATAESLKKPLIKHGHHGAVAYDVFETAKWPLLSIGLVSILIGIIAIVVTKKDIKTYDVQEFPLENTNAFEEIPLN